MKNKELEVYSKFLTKFGWQFDQKFCSDTIMHSELIDLNSVRLAISFKGNVQTFFSSVEAQTHLVRAIANVTQPVAAIILAHRSDERA